MDIKKIKWTKTGVTIAYALPEANEDIVLNCTDEPMPSFIEALNAFREDVATICHLDDKWAEEGLITGVSIKYTDEGYGANVTAQLRGDDNMALIVNTPYIAPDKMKVSVRTAIDALCEEAEKYINGDRQIVQGELFDKGKLFEVVK